LGEVVVMGLGLGEPANQVVAEVLVLLLRLEPNQVEVVVGIQAFFSEAA